MKKTILLYGLALALLMVLLKALEYRFWIRDLRVEVYLGVVALLFSSLGIWAGLRLTRRPEPRLDLAPLPEKLAFPGEVLPQLLDKYNLSKREHEVLILIAAGYSNQEIAEKLFVSLNTVKTHSSNLFLKLDVKRRTQAVQKAKELGLL